MSEAVSLTVAGVVHLGWTRARVSRSIDTCAMRFEVEVTEWAVPESAKRRIRPGSSCQLRLGGTLVMDGYVDEVAIDYDATSHKVRVVGRDASADLVDCAACVDGSHEWLGLGLLEAAGRLLRPYGISVRSEVDTGTPIPRLAIQPGETAWEALERACRSRGVLATSDGFGGLVLTRAGRGGRMPAVLQAGGQGGQVLRAAGRWSHVDRHSLYVCRGQQEGGSGLSADQVRGPEARLADTEITRYRPLVLLAESTGDGRTLADRAAWAMRVNNGRSRTVVYEVQGWRCAGGLWRPNAMLGVSDRWMEVDGELLIVAVDFVLDERGTLAQLELAPPDAYAIEPEGDRAPAASAATTGDGGGGPKSLWREDGR